MILAKIATPASVYASGGAPLSLGAGHGFSAGGQGARKPCLQGVWDRSDWERNLVSILAFL